MNQIIKLQGAKGLYLAPQQHDAQTFIKVFTNQAKQQKTKRKTKK